MIIKIKYNRTSDNENKKKKKIGHSEFIVSLLILKKILINRFFSNVGHLEALIKLVYLTMVVVTLVSFSVKLDLINSQYVDYLFKF